MSVVVAKAQKLRAIRLYKELMHLGREYPDPSYNFNGRMRSLFERHRGLTDPEQIERALQLGEFIRNETIALYSLRKYRHLKRTYYAEPEKNETAVQTPIDPEALEKMAAAI
ncbi:hypothetical protein BKA62DRAFT_686509 [Auriculariales sp. MPI-PUGE-AT-0066]|nr:hypothetical protein BKA62DRAFT_686509 [Auriculariales sp. MPI-PUGE-AT-0066]